MQNQIRTPEEIENYKRSWKNDPCFDLEDTEDFAAHREELLAYRHACEAEWERKDLESLEKDAARQGVTVDQARIIRTETEYAMDHKADAMRYFRNFLRNVSGLYEDFDGEAESMIQHIVKAAVAEAKIEIIRGLK